jgi:cytochrome c oxidase subunit 6a
MWRTLTYVVALPGVALCMLNVYLGLDDAEAHSAPPFVAYDYMRIRNKAS